MKATITFTTKIDDVLVDAGELTLTDPAETPTYGVKCIDTGEVVVSAGTVVPKVATGTFELEFNEPTEDATYTVWERFVYAGETYYVEHTYFAYHAGDSKIPDEDRIALVGAVLASPVSIFQGQRPRQFYLVA